MKIEKSITLQNKKARFEYEILEQFEAGMVLMGTEIKALRSGKASITESFCQFKDGALWVVNMSIEEYKLGTFYNHKPRRERKLLLNRRELNKLEKAVKDTGTTIVPLKLYITARGLAKLQIGLAKGKKLYDKRQSIKERETKIGLNRLLKTV